MRGRRMDQSLDFALGENADMIRETTARFAADRIAPLAAQIDAEDWFPRDLWPEMGQLGLHGVTVEQEWGGLGLGYLERSEEHTSELQSLMRISYAVFCLKKQKNIHKKATKL